MPTRKQTAAQLLREYQEIEPDIGKADHSPCVDDWICYWSRHYESGVETLEVDRTIIRSMYHTLLAALARNNRLTKERDDALARLS